jgi:hypothetical protein
VILAAGLLVLLGLGLFVAGILTGTTALYWACVGVCVVAAVLLMTARRRLPAGPATAGTSTAPAPPAAAPPAAAPPAAAPPAVAPSVAEAGEAAPVPPATPPTGADDGRRRDATAAEAPAPPEEWGEPPAEDVEVTDLLLVVDLKDEVLVVDEHPRYHLDGCAHLAGRTPIPLPVDEARTDGFTPCGVCRPDRTLAERVRARKAAGSN